MTFDVKTKTIDEKLNELRNVMISAYGGCCCQGKNAYLTDETVVNDVHGMLDEIIVLVKEKAAKYKNWKPTKNPEFVEPWL